MKNIVLIGIMGCGKTTIAKELGKRLNKSVVDLDEYLVNKYHQSINEMFEISEAYFRDKESACCKDIADYQNYIISTGGGVVKRSHNIELLKQNGIIIYLDRPLNHIVNDVETSSRPLLKDGAQKLYEIHEQRHQLYLDACDIHVINDKNIEDIVNLILKEIKSVYY